MKALQRPRVRGEGRVFLRGRMHWIADRCLTRRKGPRGSRERAYLRSRQKRVALVGRPRPEGAHA